jgi:hypothetical protein
MSSKLSEPQILILDSDSDSESHSNSDSDSKSESNSDSESHNSHSYDSQSYESESQNSQSSIFSDFTYDCQNTYNLEIYNELKQLTIFKFNNRKNRSKIYKFKKSLKYKFNPIPILLNHFNENYECLVCFDTKHLAIHGICKCIDTFCIECLLKLIKFHNDEYITISCLQCSDFITINYLKN